MIKGASAPFFCVIGAIMTTITLTHQIAKAAAAVNQKMTASNFKFAVAKSLTDLAQRSQERIRLEMPQRFILRRKWVQQGIRIKTATKSGLWSAVYSVDSGGRRPFMSIQEFGGKKLPMKSKHVAIPLSAAQPNKRVLIRPEMKPKSLLASSVAPPEARGVSTYMRQSGSQKTITRGRGANKVTRRVKINFANPYKTILVKGKQPGTEVILIRVGKKYKPAWFLKKSANIKQTNFLMKPTRAVVKESAGYLFQRNLLLAIKPK